MVTFGLNKQTVYVKHIFLYFLKKQLFKITKLLAIFANFPVITFSQSEGVMKQ